MDPSRVIDCQGAPFSCALLEILLRILNEGGEITVRNMQPGSVDLMQLGANLARRAELAQRPAWVWAVDPATPGAERTVVRHIEAAPCAYCHQPVRDGHCGCV